MAIKPTQANVKGVEDAVNNYILRAKELNGLYQEYGVKYQGLDAVTRRFLGINAATTDGQVQQVVYAKFMLAAVMEWAPSNYHFSVQSFVNAGCPVFKTDEMNEMCPCWESFFADLQEAAALLEMFIAEPQLAFDYERLLHVGALIEVAEMKAGWCESLLKTVEQSTKIRGFKKPTSEGETYRVWNQFCLNICDGITVPAAALRFKETSNRLQVYPQANKQRLWFSSDTDAQPWQTHADAIVQQPRHLLPPRKSYGMYANEAQVWMLDKSTDVHINHWDCSLISPCCLRPHIHCSANSPCRTMSPKACPHKRAGAECNDESCKVVDWGKYSLCLPVVPVTHPSSMDQRLMMRYAVSMTGSQIEVSTPA